MWNVCTAWSIDPNVKGHFQVGTLYAVIMLKGRVFLQWMDFSFVGYMNSAFLDQTCLILITELMLCLCVMLIITIIQSCLAAILSY